jgi:hypothetical protein
MSEKVSETDVSTRASTIGVVEDVLERMDDEQASGWMIEYLPMLQQTFSRNAAAELTSHLALRRLQGLGFVVAPCNSQNVTTRLRELLRTKMGKGGLTRRVEALIAEFTTPVVAEVLSEEAGSL